MFRKWAVPVDVWGKFGGFRGEFGEFGGVKEGVLGKVERKWL